MIDWQAFHFIRPEWLWVIPISLLIALLLSKVSAKRSGWQSIVSSHLYQRLVISKDKKASTPPFYLLALCLSIASLAVAGPTWNKLPQPVYQVETGKVVILDMSMSMRATDLQPNRLSRAKFKTIDLLNSLEDGEVGLVVYAGDAFTVSPLTADPSNITALVPSLRPEIMPLPGSDPFFAFEEAERLLNAAGYAKGEIYWITDGIEFEDVEELRDFVAKSNYRYSVLGVGTRDGAPIKLSDGGFLKDTRGNIVLPSLNSNLIEQVLGTTTGRYTPIQNDDSDIQNMIFDTLLLDQEQIGDEVLGQGDQWQDMGAYLVLLILPFAAYAFRRGVLVIVLGSVLIILPQEQAYASQWFDSIFKNDDQKGLSSFEKKNYRIASEQFDDPMWKGAALYKNKDFEAALKAFEQVPGAESHYNQGNTLAQLGQFVDAIAQYNKTLELHPGHANALQNKKILEDLLDQQQEQESESQNQEQQDSGEGQDSEQSQSQGQDGEQSESDESQGNASDSNESSEEQSAEQNREQQSENGEQSESQQESQQDTQSDTDSQQENQANEGEQQQSSQAQPEEQQDGEQKAAVQQIAEEDMTPEQREQAQRMQMLMNKVPDDPAYLLQRKMLLESQKRRRERISRPNQKDW